MKDHLAAAPANSQLNRLSSLLTVVGGLLVGAAYDIVFIAPLTALGP